MRGKHLNSGIRGGLWDDEYFQRMGPSVWLFGWLVHRQTRERDGVGLVLGGSPMTYEAIREDTGIAPRTLKRWMARLVRGGYVCVTHVAHKRMVIQISKAKKFGPQQLRFPQEQGSFPQIPFFASKSKGPLRAPGTASKGPIVAQESFPKPGQQPRGSGTCDARVHPYREDKPERKETKSHSLLNFSGMPNQQGPSSGAYSNERPFDERQTRTQAKASQAFATVSSPRAYPIRYSADRKLLRELEILAELRVGAGPEIHRE